MRMGIPLALLGAGVLLSGCGARARREALKDCSFVFQGLTTLEAGDSLVITAKIEVDNPGANTAVLDSFEGLASGGRPLARLSHGRTLRIAAGATDTADIHVRIAKQSMLATALALAFAPPDSVRLEGTAWIPGFFGGLSAHPVRMSLPWDRIAPQLRSLMPGP